MFACIAPDSCQAQHLHPWRRKPAGIQPWRPLAVWPSKPSPEKKEGPQQGPFGLTWLLERVADFGCEEPRRKPSVGPAPAPLQLLVSESVALEGGRPAAVFFSDRGGFLRGARAPARGSPLALFQSLGEIGRQRRGAEVQSEQRPSRPPPQPPPPSARHSLAPPAPPPSPPALAPVSELELSDLESMLEMHAGGRLDLEHLQTEAKAQRKERQLPCSDPGHWRLLGDSTQYLLDRDVAWVFGAESQDLAGARRYSEEQLLQLCFWRASEHGERIFLPPIVYEYDALRDGGRELEQSARYALLNSSKDLKDKLMDISDRNLVSAVPVLLSQHLAYRHNLQMVSGRFEFVRDCRQQIWLTNAENVMVLPTRVSGRREDAEAQGASAHRDGETRQLYRYLSEEALHNTLVSPEVGEACQEMLELMHSDYHRMKTMHGAEELLQKAEWVADISLPVLEGTDTAELARIFREELQAGREAKGLGRAPPRRAKSQGQRALRPRSRGGGDCAAIPHWTSQLLAAGARQGAGRNRVQVAQSARGERRPQRPRAAKAARAEEGETGDGHVEIVATDALHRLLDGCGPGVQLVGPSLDNVGRAFGPGQGLLQRHRAAQPLARLVRVPEPEPRARRSGQSAPESQLEQSGAALATARSM